MSPIADLAARRRACRDFRTPLVVVAGAGTGKTTTLVARAVTWIVGPGWEEAALEEPTDSRRADRAVDGVLAITFTKAAAAEMDARVRAALRELEGGVIATGVELPAGFEAVDDSLRARARALRLALDRPLATTIHGFCQGLLAEHPLESGLAPDFVVDAEEDLVADHARRAATEDLADAFRGASDADWLILARAGVGPDAVARNVAALRTDGVRATDLEHDPASDAVLSRCVDALEPAVRAFAPACRILAGLRGTNIVGAARAVLALEVLFDAPEREPLHELVSQIAEVADKGALAKLLAWECGTFDKSAAEALGAAHDEVQGAAARFGAAFRPLARFDLHGFRARRAIVRRVLARAERLDDETAVVTFGDLLARAARLVEDDRGVRDQLRRRYRQVLVDEFQDTDDVQVRLVRALTLGDGPGPPGLFLVGDPKQSIYGFRGADLAAYDAFVAEVLEAGGEQLELVQNFRSTPRVLEAVERFVAPIMHAERGVQPPFQALVPIGAEPGPEVELWAAWNPPPSDRALGKTTAHAARRLEAAELSRALRAERAAGTPWKEMAVLARARTGLEVAFEALRAADIPYQVEGGRGYYQRREIVDAAALLGAIVDAGDTLSLLAFLRSSACGLPDAALEPLWQGDFASDAQRLGGPDGDAALRRIVAAAGAVERELTASATQDARCIPQWAAALEHALASLAILRRSLVEDPADRFVERLRELLLVEPAEAGRFQGRYRTANLERFLRRVGEALEAEGDPTAVLRALRRSIDERRDAREARPAGDVEDAVRFLTIHAAKGLEFAAVFLVGLSTQARQGAARDGFDRRSGAARVCGVASPGWTRVEDSAAARDAAERVRLLYVALTRAKSRLALSAVWREDPKHIAPRAASTFRDLAEHGLPVDFALRAVDALGEPRHAYLDSGFAVRLAVAASGGEDDRRRAAHDGTGFLERALRDAAQLALLAPLAAARADRPLIAVGSGAALRRAPGEFEAPARGVRALSALAPRRDDARIAGTLVHAALEHAPDFDAARARLARDAAGSSPGVLAEARAVLDAVARGPLAARFRGDAIVARELALVTPAHAGEEPIEAWTGSADLVLCDGGGWTVVDFKSGALAGRDAREAAREHAPQLDLYARALHAALELQSLPRREVWFLREGLAIELD